MAASDHILARIKALPDKPGVYQYYDADQVLLYVGKAKSLKKRVSSYFTKQKYESGKTAVLVRKIRDLKYIVVDTEWDALFLENSLIKKHQPRYNIQLRDDKSFPWICIKKERFPRVFPTRTILKDGSKYYGPYASVRVMNAILDLIKQLYPLRNCNYNLSEENIKNKKFKVCLEYHLGNCLGPCEGLQSVEDYDIQVEQIRQIIKGNISALMKHYKELMKKHAEAYQYEKAQLIKEKLDLLTNYKAKSVIVNPKIDNTDVFSIVSDESAGYVNYLKIIKGAITQTFTIELKKKIEETDEDMLALAIGDIMDRFDSSAKEIIVPFKLDVTESISENDLKFLVPQKGDKKKLLELSERNAKHYQLNKKKVIHEQNRSASLTRPLEQLKKDLRLKETPTHIECFDNSNFQGSFPVAAMVVFINGKPRKKEYRHYNIKTVEGPDDFASMEEVVYRRYKRLLEEKKPLPQLIVIDGGKGQLSAARKSLKELNLSGTISIIGIAKRLEEIYFPNDSVPLYLDKKSESLKIIQRLRNEAHRFGITHHRNKTVKETVKSELLDIKGIGASTTEVLLKHFNSVKRIREASKQELGKVIGASKAADVYKHFKQRS
ncbi:MAG: excinuclease ABC subunit UvrC [Flavobacteriales bacterium]|nr:excinuclease ABC subunit UvrC [Flavobacteriales bacterium]